MRLIDARRIHLVDVVEDRIPEYAILSHTWGQDEVSFQDIQGPHASTKAGYTKIKYACQEALKSNLDYLWVDTCCIDKSSSAELSEAINSMFRWYRKSSICYAYLADVEGSDYTDDDCQDAMTALKKSRWFTRGWTLQELLAPAKLYFYSREWGKIGSREALADAISAITKIDQAFLLGRSSIGQASVAKRMSWASGRVTTRLEDTAYCLLGIFDVNMPLLYGEGEKAFIRLQEEIMRTSDDQSLFAWGQGSESQMGIDPRSHLVGLLAPSPAEFSNRGNIVPDESAEIEEPYTLTNRGVRLTLPVYKAYAYPYRDMMVLACRPEWSLLHVLVMPLTWLGNSQFARRWESPHLVPRDHIPVLVKKVIYMRQTLETSNLSVTIGVARSIDQPAFWIRTFPSTAGVYIKEVEPVGFWNAQHRIIRRPSHAFEEAWQVAITMAIGETNRVILLGYSNGYPFCSLDHASDDLFQKEGEYNPSKNENSVSPLSHVEVKLGKKVMEAMGIRMISVDVKISSANGTRPARKVLDRSHYQTMQATEEMAIFSKLSG